MINGIIIGLVVGAFGTLALVSIALRCSKEKNRKPLQSRKRYYFVLDISNEDVREVVRKLMMNVLEDAGFTDYRVKLDEDGCIDITVNGRNDVVCEVSESSLGDGRYEYKCSVRVDFKTYYRTLTAAKEYLSNLLQVDDKDE